MSKASRTEMSPRPNRRHRLKSRSRTGATAPNRKRFRNALVFLLCAAAVFALFAAAGAEESGSREENGFHGVYNAKEPVPGIELHIYRIGTVSVDGEYSLSAPYTEYGITFDNTDSEAWAAAALAFTGYVARDKITPDSVAVTDENGRFRVSSLPDGIYLVSYGAEIINSEFYTSEPFIVSLPHFNGTVWETEYEVVPKIERRSVEDTTEIRVIKIWNDDGNRRIRPDSITVQLLRDSEVFGEAELDSGNNWQHLWTKLESGHEWRVIEKTVPAGYSVSVKHDGTEIIITNTTSDDDETSDDIPQTGQLWWPVFVFLGAGVLCLLIGLIASRGRKTGSEE